MRERSRDKSRLEHMIQAIERIRRYTSGKTFEDFIADDTSEWYEKLHRS